MSGNEITLSHDRVDSRVLAAHLGNDHRSTFKLVRDHLADFDQFGKVRFEISPSPGSVTGQKERFALLNEDQAYLLLTYSRNTAKVRALKINLVKAFSEARRAAAIRQVEYLPAYHELHDAIKDLACGTPNERWLHVNANKVLNQLAGIDSGQRAGAGPMAQSLLAVGSMLAAKAVRSSRDHHEIHKRIKTALEPLKVALRLEG